MTNDDETSGTDDGATSTDVGTDPDTELQKLREENERLRSELSTGTDGLLRTARRRNRISVVMAV